MARTRCSWCGTDVSEHDGYRLAEEAGERVAAFCRLEHVIPWAIQGAHWDAGTLAEHPREDPELARCAQCGVDVDDTRVLLIRHRDAHRVGDAFCGVDHLLAWAKAGGRWA